LRKPHQNVEYYSPEQGASSDVCVLDILNCSLYNKEGQISGEQRWITDT